MVALVEALFGDDPVPIKVLGGETNRKLDLFSTDQNPTQYGQRRSFPTPEKNLEHFLLLEQLNGGCPQ